MTDFTVLGWRGVRLPVPQDFQVTMQSRNGDKMRAYERTVWFVHNNHTHIYVVYEMPANLMVVAQAIHHALWRDLASETSWLLPNDKIGLHISVGGFSEYFDLHEKGRSLREKSRSMTAISGRKRGTVVTIENSHLVIKAGGLEYSGRLSAVSGNKQCSAIKMRAKIRVGTDVTFMPVGTDALAIMVAKETTKRHEREEIVD